MEYWHCRWGRGLHQYSAMADLVSAIQRQCVYTSGSSLGIDKPYSAKSHFLSRTLPLYRGWDEDGMVTLTATVLYITSLQDSYPSNDFYVTDTRGPRGSKQTFSRPEISSALCDINLLLLPNFHGAARPRQPAFFHRLVA